MTTLPEEAVTSAAIIQVITDLRLAILQDDDEGLAEHAEPMVKAKELIAKLSASPFLSVQGAVKKLQWELVSGDHYAEGAGTHYNIYETKPGLWNSVTVKPVNVRLATNVALEAAKAAAQADLEARILSALEPSAARELALEALKAAYASMEGSCSANHRIALNTVDAAIRTLSSPDHADAGKVEGDGWLPIESAPKDGTVIDLWSDEYGRLTDCYWGSPMAYEGGETGWVHAHSNEWAESPDEFVHWRPLPSAPSEGAE